MNELIKTSISKTHNWVLQFKQENSPSIPTHPQTRLPKKKNLDYLYLVRTFCCDIYF